MSRQLLHDSNKPPSDEVGAIHDIVEQAIADICAEEGRIPESEDYFDDVRIAS